MPILINVVMTEPSISPRNLPAYQEREQGRDTTSVWPRPLQTVGDTFVCVRVHSHHSAAWKPGQNHDYQLHSSPNPVMRNRENNRPDEYKKAHCNLHTVSDLCQQKFDHLNWRINPKYTHKAATLKRTNPLDIGALRDRWKELNH